jgi:hypothetical protein
LANTGNNAPNDMANNDTHATSIVTSHSVLWFARSGNLLAVEHAHRWPGLSPLQSHHIKPAIKAVNDSALMKKQPTMPTACNKKAIRPSVPATRAPLKAE